MIDLPFNWDAGLDIRALSVGYLEAAFHESNRHEDWRKNDHQVLEQVRSLGVTLEPFELPKLPLIVVNGLGPESGASFDEFVRAGRDKEMTNRNRSNGFRQSRLMPAVEYLQSQRVRAMIMRQFAEADPAGSSAGRGSGGRGGTAPPSLIRDHFQVANICGYPAVSVPNGFTADGKPTSITFMGRLYGEAGMLALARAYQDRAGWHRKHPNLE